jgi:hypothetical protein
MIENAESVSGRTANEWIIHEEKMHLLCKTCQQNAVYKG